MLFQCCFYLICMMMLALPVSGEIPHYAIGFWNSSGDFGYEFSPAPGKGYVPLAEPSNRYLNEQEVIYLTNLEREKQGLLPLRRNELLDQSAILHAQDMRDQDYFDHTSKDGRSPSERIEASGYDYSWSGENIAGGYNTPAAVVDAWMESEGHRANILRPEFREIGVGVAEGGGSLRIYWVQNFGSQRDVYPVVIDNEVYQTDSRTVELKIYGEEAADLMRISNNSDFGGAEWIPFESTVSWELPPGNGEKTVYVQLMRESGVTFDPQSDSIVLYGQAEATATPTMTPTPAPTPVPPPTELTPMVVYEFDSLAPEFTHYPGGFGDAAAGESSPGAVPTDSAFEGATDGTGLVFDVDPSEVSLVVGSPLDVGESLVLLRCSVRTTGAGVHVALGTLDGSMDGSINTSILADTLTTSGVWRQLTMIYNPPHGSVIPLIQAANLSGDGLVTCYIDRLEVFLIDDSTALTGGDLGAGPVAP